MKFLEILNALEKKYSGLKKCIIIGDPVEHSLSPAMHNNGYKDLELNFVFDKINVKEEELDEFISDLKIFNNQFKSVVGITCTMPHKVSIIKYLDEVKDEAKIIGAVNSVLFNGEKYIGYNTDWFGIEEPFNMRDIKLGGKKAAILGAGGASKSAIYAFQKNNCSVSIFNRTKSKADLLAKIFNIASFGLDDVDAIEKCDIIINTTSVGMGLLKDESPIDTKIIKKNHIVFECIYSPKETKLVRDAKNVGADIIYGWEMLLYQGVKQFEIYTDISPKIEILRSAL